MWISGVASYSCVTARGVGHGWSCCPRACGTIWLGARRVPPGGRCSAASATAASQFGTPQVACQVDGRGRGVARVAPRAAQDLRDPALPADPRRVVGEAGAGAAESIGSAEVHHGQGGRSVLEGPISWARGRRAQNSRSLEEPTARQPRASVVSTGVRLPLNGVGSSFAGRSVSIGISLMLRLPSSESHLSPLESASHLDCLGFSRLA